MIFILKEWEGMILYLSLSHNYDEWLDQWRPRGYDFGNFNLWVCFLKF